MYMKRQSLACVKIKFPTRLSAFQLHVPLDPSVLNSVLLNVHREHGLPRVRWSALTASLENTDGVTEESMKVRVYPARREKSRMVEVKGAHFAMKFTKESWTMQKL